MTQLGVKGPQDYFLLDNTQMTFFRSQIVKHANFAMSENTQHFCSNVGFDKHRMDAKLDRAGDLLTQMYLYAEIAPIGYDPSVKWAVRDVDNSFRAHYSPKLGYAMLRDINLLIGNHPMDQQSGMFLDIFEQVSKRSDSLAGELVGDVEDPEIAALNTQEIMVPLQWYFCRFTEQALPLISLYWHGVTVQMSTRALRDLIIYTYYGIHNNGEIVSPDAVYNGTTVKSRFTIAAHPIEMYLIMNLAYCDKRERSMFANGKLEYVFDQVQMLGSESHSKHHKHQQISIRYNHPCGEVFVVCQRDDVLWTEDAQGNRVPINNWCDYSGVPSIATGGPADAATALTLPERDAFSHAQIFLNNQERTCRWHAAFFRHLVPMEHHTSVPRSFIYNYAFGLKPEALIDTGSVNMSRMDNAFVRMCFPSQYDKNGLVGDENWTGNIHTAARNKNIGKVSLGMFGLRYAA